MGKFRVFNIPVKSHAVKILFVTDAHAGHPMGNFTLPDGKLVGEWDRMDIMVDAINKEITYEDFDAIICLGDMTSNEFNSDKVENDLSLSEKYKGTRFSPREQFLIEHYTNDQCYFTSDSRENNFFKKLKNEYMSKIDKPTFYIYANHDDLFDDEWEDFLGYGKNYIIHFGEELTVICADNFHDQPECDGIFLYGFGYKASDISKEFYEFCKNEIKGRKNVILASHFPQDECMPLLKKLVEENDNVIASICGHTHGLNCESFGKKPRIESGHFSLELKSWGKADEKTGKGAWGFRYLEITRESAETWMVYPENDYGILPGADFEPFHQPRYSTKNTLHKGYVDLSDLIQIK